jgi:hypothetical protein
MLVPQFKCGSLLVLVCILSQTTAAWCIRARPAHKAFVLAGPAEKRFREAFPTENVMALHDINELFGILGDGASGVFARAGAACELPRQLQSTSDSRRQIFDPSR